MLSRHGAALLLALSLVGPLWAQPGFERFHGSFRGPTQDPTPKPIPAGKMAFEVLDVQWEWLAPASGWSFYISRDPFGPPPHLLALPSEVKPIAAVVRKQGIPIDLENIHVFVQPQRLRDGSRVRVPNSEAARELFVFLAGGEAPADAQTAERLLRTAHQMKPFSGPWPIEFHSDAPSKFEVSVRRAGDLYDVNGVFFSDRVRISMYRVAGQIDIEGRSSLKYIPIFTGPPARGVYLSPRGSSERDEEKEQRELERVRHAFEVAADPRRSMKYMRKLFAERPPMAKVVETLGLPDEDLGSGLHIWTYDLHDGTTLAIGEPGTGFVLYAHQLGRIARDQGQATPRVLERLIEPPSSEQNSR